MLPVEIKEHAGQHRQVILGKNVGVVIGNSHKRLIVRRCDPGVGELRIQRGNACKHHQAVDDPAGEHGFSAVVELIAGNLVNLAGSKPGRKGGQALTGSATGFPIYGRLMRNERFRS